MLIIRFVAVRAVDADPSRFVALGRPSCAFVDNSFFLSFQASLAGCERSRKRVFSNFRDRTPESGETP